MDCKQAHNLFDAYLDGELSSALETELDAHRLNCPSCRQELALMEVAGHVIRSGAGEPPLTAEFTARLLACLEPVMGQPRKRQRWIVRIATGLAAAACLTLLIVSFSRPSTQVAPYVGQSEGATPPATSVGGKVEADGPAPGLEEAAVTLQQTVDDAVRRTHESSASLIRAGEMTLLELIDALQLDKLREPESGDIPTDGVIADEDADDVEDI